MAATGMPVISTTHCDIPSVLNYGEEGWLAEERDVEGLVGILEKWLSAPELWEQRVAHARKHIESEYDAVTQGKRLGKVYRELK
jgi:colanic acid/amylovoran biosynthesis glycosyltransferase